MDFGILRGPGTSSPKDTELRNACFVKSKQIWVKQVFLMQ
jgi:hypothetical protein